ncbi:MAG: DUF1624 domain-containing protein [Lachnospiraceae bacterium]|nr:DUF1624 domain-containing protein [Lachnospiraceae bacterium]
MQIRGDIITDKKRLHLLDAYRGFVVLVMIVYHFCFDLFFIYRGDHLWPNKLPVFLWQQFICCSFIFLSGFVWKYGQRNCIKRGLSVSLCGIIVTVVTMIAAPSSPVYYGILTFLGAAMILMLPVSKVLDGISPLKVLIVSACLFLLTFSMNRGYLGIYFIKLIKLPSFLYRYDILTPLGLPKYNFISSDYFPFFPWIFLYVCGYELNCLVADNKDFIRLASVKIPVLDTIGKHSLIIYMIHQPLCMLILMLIYR